MKLFTVYQSFSDKPELQLKINVKTVDNGNVNLHQYNFTRYTGKKLMKSIFLLPVIAKINEDLFLLSGDWSAGGSAIVLSNGTLTDYLRFTAPVFESLGICEKALYFRYLAGEKEKNDFEGIAGFIFQIIHQKYSAKSIEDFCKIAYLPSCCLSLIAQKSLNLKDSLLLTLFAEDELTYLTDLFSQFFFTVSQIRLLCEMLIELKQKDGMSAVNRLTQRVASGMDAAKILDLLYREKNPIYSQALQEYMNTVNLLALPPSVKISVSPYFESSEIEVNIKTRSENDLKAGLSKLQQGIEDGIIKKIFSLLECN